MVVLALVKRIDDPHGGWWVLWWMVHLGSIGLPVLPRTCANRYAGGSCIHSVLLLHILEY